MGAQGRRAVLVLAGLLTASGWLLAAGPQALTQAERRAIHARVMDEGVLGDIPQLLALRSDDIFLPNPRQIVDEVVGSDDDAVMLSLVCYSKVVVVAKAGEPESFMTAGQGWIYTEWPFEIAEVIKAEPQYGLRRSRTMIVLQSGGTIRLNGRTVTAGSPAEWPDVVTGSTYLLFAGARVEETGALQIFEGIEMGRQRPSKEISRYPRLRSMAPEPLKTMALRQTKNAAARQHCNR